MLKKCLQNGTVISDLIHAMIFTEYKVNLTFNFLQILLLSYLS